MHSFVRRSALIGALAAVLVGMLGPSADAAANPYSPEAACHNDFGGTWIRTADGHRDVVTAGPAQWGDVWLMYNRSTGYNCVTAIKSAFVSARTWTEAYLWVQGDLNTHSDTGAYQYYAAVQAPARGRCVQYLGVVENDATVGGRYASGGRFEWGNCS